MLTAILSGFRRPGTTSHLLRNLALFAVAGLLQTATAQTNVHLVYFSNVPVLDSIGGGPIPGKYTAANGYHDGNTFNGTQFDGPVGTAIDSQGNLFIADKNNNAIRKVLLAGDTANSYTITFLNFPTNVAYMNSNQVVAVATDPSDNVYVVTRGTSSALYKYNSFANPIYSMPLASFGTNPTALALQISGPTNIFITFTNSATVSLLNVVQSTDGLSIVTNKTVVTPAFNWRPSGLAVKLNGDLLVSDLASNAIYLVANQVGTTPVHLLGTNSLGSTNTAGWFDGANTPQYQTAFNQPYGLAVASDGSVIVADFGNSAIRLIDTNLHVFTVYGTTTNNWGAQFPNYPGWLDGTPGNTKTNASSRQPISVTLSTKGLLFVTDLKFNVLRDLTGLGLTAATVGGGGPGGTGGTNAVPPSTPVITPDAGYFPQCQPVVVSNDFGIVYYTTDGTEPTTNSLQLVMTSGVGTIMWCDPLHDLSFLKVKAFNGTASSDTVGGSTLGFNRIGFTGPTFAGIGSTVVIPIVLNVQPGITLKSMQFRVEVTPIGGQSNTPPKVDSMALLSTTTNDFIVYAGLGPNGVTNVTFPYSNSSNGLGMVVTALADTTAMAAQNFGVIAPLAVKIPNTAVEGQAYRLQILFPSGTSDAQQQNVSIGTMPNSGPYIVPTNFPILTNIYANVPPIITTNIPPVTNIVVGVSTNIVVTNVYANTTNIFPYIPNTVPLIPPVTNIVVNTTPITNVATNILMNLTTFATSTNVVTNVYANTTNVYLRLTNSSQTLVVFNQSYLTGDSSPGGGYNAGEFGSDRLNNADVNNAVYAALGFHVPYTFSDVYNAMDVYPQSTGIAGDGFITFLDWETILFRSEFLDVNWWQRSWSAGGNLVNTSFTADPAIYAPASAPKAPPPGQVWLAQACVGTGSITNAIPGNSYTLPVYASVLPGYSLAGFQFRATLLPNGNAPAPGTVVYTPLAGTSLSSPSPNDVLSTAAFGTIPPLQSSNVIGYVTFQIPPTATVGQSYTLRFSYVDGAADINTPYRLESFPGTIWVLASAGYPPSRISDEWKIKFFGSVTNPLAADNADPDGDGQSNLQEYLAGTDPTSASSRLQFTDVHPGSGHSVSLHWLSAPAKNYLLETAPSLGSTNWTSVGTYAGDGNLQESTQNNNSEKARFYRLRLQP